MKKKYLIVIADYYKDISKGLLSSAKSILPKSSLIKIINVPGVFEIPVTISKNIKKYDAFLVATTTTLLRDFLSQLKNSLKIHFL